MDDALFGTEMPPALRFIIAPIVAPVVAAIALVAGVRVGILGSRNQA